MSQETVFRYSRFNSLAGVLIISALIVELFLLDRDKNSWLVAPIAISRRMEFALPETSLHRIQLIIATLDNGLPPILALNKGSIDISVRYDLQRYGHPMDYARALIGFKHE